MQSSNRAADLTAVLGDAPEATDHEAVGKFVHRLAEAGCNVLFILPGSKLPADMRTPAKRRADDQAAAEAARDAGRRDWQQVRSPAGLALATTDTAILDGYLDKYVKVFASRYPDGVPVNLAIETGASRLAVVDCDNAEQMQRWYEIADDDIEPGTPPTVRSPGQIGPDGEWVHSDGGHFWFTVPEGVDLPGNPGAMTWGGDDGFAVLWNRRYALIPPSVRVEGPYTASGEVRILSDRLAEAMADTGRLRAERAERSRGVLTGGGGDAVQQWGADTTWEEILAPTGWLATGKTDGCGCETWTAPGTHASAKSATAHEPGCAFNDSPDPHLQVWTDHDADPFEHWRRGGEASFPVSRLQAVTAIHYDNNLGAAMADLSDAYDTLALDNHAEVAFLDNYRKAAPGSASASADDDSGTPQLPEEFWSAHPTLAHIRRFAHYGVNSADAVLGAALVRLSAHLDPCVRIVTGVKRPLPLNTFVGIVGSAGTGKSSAYHASADLLHFEFGDPMLGDLIAPADQCPPELPVGSGPGVAEAFMGTVVDPGDPTMKTKVRRQVRHKVLLHSDEGAGLVSGIIDTKRGQDIGPTLRAAWTGAVLGQANASAERTREVRDYSLGLCVGFQLEALAALSTAEQLEYGTPQRFVYVSATDPTIPDDAPDDPGPLSVKLPHGPLRYDAELRARARQEALARARGEGGGDTEDDMMQAHRPALVARCAALLVVLCDPGRTEVNAGDVALAEMLLDTSAQLHAIAMEWRRERESAERERQLQGRIREQVATAVALDGRADDMARLNERILAYVDDAGGSVEWAGRTGLRKTKFNAGDRPLADAALVRLAVGDGPLVRDGNTVRRRVS